MSRQSRSSKEKKQSNLVHKPFFKGRLNFFHPPQKNPNGHLASAKLLNEDICVARENVEDKDLEDLDALNNLNSYSVKNTEIKTNRFFNGWKIATVLLIVIGNLTAAITMSAWQRKTESVTNTLDSQELTVAGKSDLTSKEFVSLDFHNLKNIPAVTVKEESKPKSEKASSENLPLAIPPTNLPQDILLPKVKDNSQYYYILTEYTGDRSLAMAKTKVPNVSLINFPQGVFIYMGAFAQKESARQFIQQLKELGLEGYIYPFE